MKLRSHMVQYAALKYRDFRNRGVPPKLLPSVSCVSKACCLSSCSFEASPTERCSNGSARCRDLQAASSLLGNIGSKPGAFAFKRKQSGRYRAAPALCRRTSS